VSPCGRHLAVLISDNRLLLVEDFQRLVNGHAILEEIGTDIVFGSVAIDSSRYVTFYEDKVGVVTVSSRQLHEVLSTVLIGNVACWRVPRYAKLDPSYDRG
jgi:hypothetical protein